MVVFGACEVLSVYVVDDDEAVRDSLAALLEPEGFVVSTFPSADEFLKGLEERPTPPGSRACLLLDLHMPGKGGHELLEFVTRHEKSLPVIIMTGNADERTRSRAIAKGAANFLEKPVDADHLIAALLSALGQIQPSVRRT
jgi:two-component system response regulator FixJ